MLLKISSDGPINYNGSSTTALSLKTQPTVQSHQYHRYRRVPRGVIGQNGPRSPFEALKAQVILARTFAVVSGSKHGEDDLCDSWHRQVYKYRRTTAPRTGPYETSGLILRWKEPCERLLPRRQRRMVTSRLTGAAARTSVSTQSRTLRIFRTQQYMGGGSACLSGPFKA